MFMVAEHGETMPKKQIPSGGTERFTRVGG